MNTQLQHKLLTAFSKGLISEFGETAGSLLEKVIGFKPSTGLTSESLEALCKNHDAAIKSDISSGKVDGGTMLKIQSCIFANALLNNTAEVVRFATMAQQFCGQVSEGGWANTSSEWKWVASNADLFSSHAIELKRFLNQL